MCAWQIVRVPASCCVVRPGRAVLHLPFPVFSVPWLAVRHSRSKCSRPLPALPDACADEMAPSNGAQQPISSAKVSASASASAGANASAAQFSRVSASSLQFCAIAIIAIAVANLGSFFSTSPGLVLVLAPGQRAHSKTNFLRPMSPINTHSCP